MLLFYCAGMRRREIFLKFPGAERLEKTGKQFRQAKKKRI